MYDCVWFLSGLVTSIVVVVVAADRFTAGDAAPEARSTFQFGRVCGQHEAETCIFAPALVGVAATVIVPVPAA